MDDLDILTHDVNMREEQKREDGFIQKLSDSLFELKVKEAFLPLYTHSLYNKVVSENLVMIALSPEHKKLRNANNQLMGVTNNTSQSVLYP